MKVVGEALVERFARKHPTSRKPLRRFLDIVRGADWLHFAALKQSFSTADYLSRSTIVFDVGGNKFRVIAIVNFEKQIMLIDRVMTHEEYAREKF